jgi:hypothetical protein
MTGSQLTAQVLDVALGHDWLASIASIGPLTPCSNTAIAVAIAIATTDCANRGCLPRRGRATICNTTRA